MKMFIQRLMWGGFGPQLLLQTKSAAFFLDWVRRMLIKQLMTSELNGLSERWGLVGGRRSLTFEGCSSVLLGCCDKIL